jgi:hypothetical protein
MDTRPLLDIVNDVLLMDGEYSTLPTVASSPANVAERVMVCLNMTLRDLGRMCNIPELRVDLTAVSTGSTTYEALNANYASWSSTAYTVDGYIIEEVSAEQLLRHQAEGAYTAPTYFARKEGEFGGMAVDFYPAPAVGMTISSTSYAEPAPFVLTDVSVSNVASMEDILILGALAFLESYKGEATGLTQRYEAAKLKYMSQLTKNMDLRITPEDYR